MRGRRRKRGELFAEINIVPFTDIVLVLLIIFMLTANFIATGTGLNIELPGASTAVSQNQTQTAVFITADGQIYLDATPVDPAVLKNMLAAALADDERLVVVVSADRAVEYSRVVSVLDAVRSAGVKYLALAAELRSPGEVPR